MTLINVKKTLLENTDKTMSFLAKINTSSVVKKKAAKLAKPELQLLNLKSVNKHSFHNDSIESPRLDSMMHCIVDINSPKQRSKENKQQFSSRTAKRN